MDLGSFGVVNLIEGSVAQKEEWRSQRGRPLRGFGSSPTLPPLFYLVKCDEI